MAINASVTNQQITATVGETQIDVTVSGGVGPTGSTGPAGPQGPSYTLPVATASVLGGVKIGSGISVDGDGVISASAASVAWNDITGKPSTFAPSTHTHTASAITDFAAAVAAAAPPTTDASLLTSGTLPDARISGNIARTSDVSSAVAAVVNSAPATLDTLKELADALGSDANFSTTVTNSLAGKAASSHTHGNITNAGAIGSTSGQIVVTTTSGVLTTAASISSSQVSGLGTLATQNGTFSGTSSGTNTGDQTITLTGDVTGSGTGSFTATLANSGVSAGTYTSVTVDAKGRVTAGSSPAVAYSSLSGVPSTFTPASHAHGFLTNAGNLNDGANSTATNRLAMTNASGQIVAATLGVGIGVTSNVPNTIAVTYGTSGNTACVGNDSRLSDARTPTAHKSSHATGGTDALSPADIGAAAALHTHSASDITSGTIATARLATGTADATTYLRGDQTWATVSAGSTSASDLTSGTLADARLSQNVQNTENIYLWASFR